jgi:hypothetical protein
MSRFVAVSMFCAAALALPLAHAQTSASGAQAAKPASKTAKAKSKRSQSQSRKELESEAKGLALATETVAALSPAQMEIASRVLVGKADCEFSQQVQVEPAEGKPGHFKVSYKNHDYEMVPQETTTGAVRLQDKRNGVMWLQIPSKSMLMNDKIGQRMVDSCTVVAQRTTAGAAPVPAAAMLGTVAGAR